MPGTAYDFALQPDVIVINLGTNDATNAGLKITTFQTGVYNFLKTVRQKNPNAQIIWAYGLRSDKMTAKVAAAIQAAVAKHNTEGDNNVHYLPLEVASDMHLNHPTAAAYAPSGELLIQKIKEITGW
jgi:lysophospholipase L1-like esterase